MEGCKEAGFIGYPGIPELLELPSFFSLSIVLERALSNETTELWTNVRQSWQNNVYVVSEPSDFVFERERRCLPITMATILVIAVVSHRLSDFWDVSFRRSVVARMVRLASGISTYTLQHLDDVDKLRQMFERRWPRFNRLPTWLWQEAGCAVDNGKLTLFDLLLSPPSLPEMDCLSDGAVFAPRAFFDSFAQTPSLQELFSALRPCMSVRPTRFHATLHASFLGYVLQEYVIDTSQLHGLLLEFGVAEAATTNITARHVQKVWEEAAESGPTPTVFAFDSFKGLARAWGSFREGASWSVLGDDVLPPTEFNVEFVHGWFNESLPSFLHGIRATSRSKLPRVSLLHLDADLYESTLEVLQMLLPFLGPGSILIFDDVPEPSAHMSTKENWHAIFEIMQQKNWTWRVEILAAPWLAWLGAHFHQFGSLALRLTT